MSGRRTKSKSGSRMRHHRRRAMRGRGILDWISRGNSFLRKHKLISTVASALSGLHPAIGHVATGARLFGYARNRMHHGGALKLAGAGLGLAGGRRHHRRMR